MQHLRTLWRALVELLSGRLLQRLRRLEEDQQDLARAHNAHVAFVRSKLTALSKLTNHNQASLLSLAARVSSAPRQQTVQLEAFTDEDDESTIALSDEDIVMPKRRLAPGQR